MSKSLAKIRKATSRSDFLDIVNDTYLFENQKQTRYALEAVSCAWRNWLLAMSCDVPVHAMRRLTIPGVGTLRIGWRGYNGKYADRLTIRFTPVKKVRDILRAQNKVAYEKWKRENERS